MNTEQTLKIVMRERAISKAKETIKNIAQGYDLTGSDLEAYYRAIYSYTNPNPSPRTA